MHTSVPLDMPFYTAYTIVGEPYISAHLSKILKLIHPTSDTSTCESIGDAHDAGHLVLCGSNWAADRDALLGAGYAPETFSVLTVPIGDPWAYWEFSKSNIDKMKFENEVQMDVVDFERYLLHDVRTAQLDEDGCLRLNENRYAYFDQDIIERNSTTIKKVADRLSDERSRQAYLKVLMSPPRVSWAHYLAQTFRSQQYFDYINYDACKAVLNGGIWLGFELPTLMSALPDDAIVHNVDPLGFDHLTPYARRTVEYFKDRCLEHRVALDDHNGKTSFPVAPDGQAMPLYATSDIDIGEKQEFDCITVDDFIVEHGFETHGLIKFDLEAGEVNALSKMGGTVDAYRPQMAISIYHHINHYWLLPSAIMDRCPDYNFYMDYYSWERWEGILYCIPKEIDKRSSFQAVESTST
jgi:FkbM family methyltransferase